MIILLNDSIGVAHTHSNFRIAS